MKKSFYIIPLLLGLIFVSCDKDDSINERLDIIEKTHLTTINEQIENINNTIETFEETDVKLEEFIKSLQVTASSLQKSIDETNVKINNIKSELPNEIGTAKNEVLAELTSLKKDTENKLSQINTTIASLQAKEAELDKKITDLKNYVDTELSNNKDWAKATFATLEQYSTLASEIATIKSQIARINNSITELENHITEKVEKDIAYAIESFKDSFTAEVITNITDAYQQAIKDAKTEISDAYTANIATAISKLETSMQTWVSEKLKEYYTIAEVEGKIAALMTTIDDGDKATMQELQKMAESIAEIKEEVTTNYTKAIKDAINKNNGIINIQISEQIEKEVSDINNKIEELENRLSKIENDIATINEQIENINNTIEELKNVDTILEEYIKSLQSTKITEDIELINKAIATLQEKDENIKKKIEELEKYIDTELRNNKDWANASFATLGQYTSLASEVATIKAQIEAINTNIDNIETGINENITNNIEAAISKLETSMQTWVSEKLKEYYTIAEVEGKIAALMTTIDDGDKATMQELQKMAESIAEIKEEVTTNYTKAIEDAINKNNGIIIIQISEQIEKEVSDINNKIEELENRLSKIESDIAKLMKRIQSISYIPLYSDGKATLEYNRNASQAKLDFEISPKDAVSKLAEVWSSALSVKAILTTTRAVEFISMPIFSFSADTKTGVISIIVSGENLLPRCLNSNIIPSVAIVISDGNNSITSNYIPMVLEETTKNIAIPANNEILYTTTDDKALSSLYDDYFDKSITSNKYTNDLGVITFNGEVTELKPHAFSKETLKSIYLPTSITTLPCFDYDGVNGSTQTAFISSALEEVFIGGSPNLTGNPFYLCNNIKRFSGSLATNDGCALVKGSTLYSFAGSSTTEYTIPATVTTIGNSSFYDCQKLIKIVVPPSITAMQFDAFCNCYNVSVYMSSVEDWCKITFANRYANPIYTGGEDVYVNGSKISTLTIPSSITTIKKWAFTGIKVESIVIGDHVTTVEEGAFDWTVAKTVTIGKNVTSIGANAFRDTDSYKMTSLYIKATTPPNIESNTFEGYNKTIYVPKSSVNTYKNSANWSNYASQIVGYEF